MDIKLELLQNHICDYIKDSFETFPINTSKLIDSEAVMILNRIKLVINNDNLSDFEVVEQIVQIFEEYNLNCGNRHDF